MPWLLDALRSHHGNWYGGDLLDNALLIHAIAAHVSSPCFHGIFFLFPIPITAEDCTGFPGFVVGMDFFVVALIINRSLDMFTSLLGTGSHSC